MSKTVYAIDACALIDAAKNYNMKLSVFMPIWDKLAEMFEEGTLISNCEIFDELKDDDLVKWIQPYKRCFMSLDKATQDKTKEILAIHPKLISLKKGKKGNSNGDPFLIATALLNQCTVVTNERMAGQNGGGCKIPDVCIYHNLQYIDLVKFIEIIMDDAA